MKTLSDVLGLNLVDGQPTPADFPEAGSEEERATFDQLQEKLPNLFRQTFQDTREARTVVVIPSLSLHNEVLAKISGVHHYEERLLFMLMLLRMPQTRLIYVTSQPIAPSIIDYYLHLLHGIPGTHARRRLTLLSCYDASTRALSKKILSRPRLMLRIREHIPNPETAHMACFNTTNLERSLAVQLGIPLYACDPALSFFGSKSGSRETFIRADVPIPDGFENLGDEADLVDALTQLKTRHPDMQRAVVKLNEGFSGEGNAIFPFAGSPVRGQALKTWIQASLPSRLRFEARDETWERYNAKFREMTGIAEVFLEGSPKRSPSVQCRIDPLGEIQILSTHDQVLGGPSGQIFLGCTFPADPLYRAEITRASRRVAETLREEGVLGRFGVDFIARQEDDGWKHYAIEINLRKGGTTHPFEMLQFLTDGTYDADAGRYQTPTGRPCYYYASDNLQHPAYRGLSPEDLIDISAFHGLHFDGSSQQGVVFHLIGALSEFGKLGVVCIGDRPTRARILYKETVNVLNREVRATHPTAR
jgi:hypothetical protein